MEAAARAELVAQGRQLKEQLSQLEAILDEAEAELQQEAQKLPNLTHPQVPNRTESAPSTPKFARKRGIQGKLMLQIPEERRLFSLFS